MGDRTKSEKQANQMDMDVYRMMTWAEREADEFHVGSPRGKLWKRAADALNACRAPLRQLMHEDDRKDTAG